MYSYTIAEEGAFSPDYGSYTAYGIKVYGREGFVQYIPNITMQRDELEELTVLCNRLQLHVIHFYDVAMDFISQ